MLKYLALSLAFLCYACVSAPPPPPPAPPPPAAEGPELKTPGMIPLSCEALLQKSQEWNYKPGEKWKPANKEQALEVANFFANFTLVPEATSRALREWVNSAASGNEAEAQATMKKLESLQFCDHTLAMTFLDAILQYPWKKNARDQVARDFSRFLLNQQSRVSLLESRAVTVHVLKNAREKKLIPGSAAAATKLRMEIQKAKAALVPVQIAEKEPSALENEKSMRKELAFSENIRERLAHELPLP